MSGYFVTELQQHLQRRADELCAIIANAPGLCSAGRMVSTDDVDRVGLDFCAGMLATDGAFGFRLVHAERTAAISEFLAARGHRVDWWDTFTGISDSAQRVSEQIAARGPPAGLHHVDLCEGPREGPREADLERVQAFLSAHGIAPFSWSTLAGETVTGRAFALVDERGDLVATSFTYMPHNSSSEFRGFAWVGLVAVAPAYRGRSIGTYMNACATTAAFTRFGATLVYEQVTATNTPSRRVVEACGLALHPNLKSGLASTGKGMFTRWG
jgi:Acetyltransferase (GNAT) family